MLIRGLSPIFVKAWLKNNVMIRKNLIKCNLIKVKKSGAVLFEEYMAHFRPELETCPYCGVRGECCIFAYYNRGLIDFVNGHPLLKELCVLRVICSCMATHAILFDPIIPYERHSLFFILRVLAEHFLHLKSVERICEIYAISMTTFHRWKKLYEKHRQMWQGTLASIETSLRNSILILLRKAPHCSFSLVFFRQSGFSFMQSHKNPVRSQRMKKPLDSTFP